MQNGTGEDREVSDVSSCADSSGMSKCTKSAAMRQITKKPKNN